MSFAEKISSIMQRPGQDPTAKDDVSWWMKYAGRGLGTVGSLKNFSLFRRIYLLANAYKKPLHRRTMLKRGVHSLLLIFLCPLRTYYIYVLSYPSKPLCNTLLLFAIPAATQRSVAIFLGAWNCASILLGSIDCLISGMWQMVAGFIVVMIEAPCCCLFIDFVQNLSDWVEKRPYWNRAAGYCLMAVPPVFLCFGISSVFGSGLIFATGVIYGLMSLGRKAPLREMISSATNVEVPSSSMQATLVENAQPMGFSNRSDSNI